MQLHLPSPNRGAMVLARLCPGGLSPGLSSHPPQEATLSLLGCASETPPRGPRSLPPSTCLACSTAHCATFCVGLRRAVLRCSGGGCRRREPPSRPCQPGCWLGPPVPCSCSCFCRPRCLAEAPLEGHSRGPLPMRGRGAGLGGRRPGDGDA